MNTAKGRLLCNSTHWSVSTRLSRDRDCIDWEERWVVACHPHPWVRDMVSIHVPHQFHALNMGKNQRTAKVKVP